MKNQPSFSETALRFLTVGAVLCAALSPDGKMLATGGRQRPGGKNFQGEFFLWDMVTGEQKARRRIAENTVLDLSFLPNGERLAVFHETIGIYRVANLLRKPLLDVDRP